jgi:hypothetical protein
MSDQKLAIKKWNEIRQSPVIRMAAKENPESEYWFSEGFRHGMHAPRKWKTLRSSTINLIACQHLLDVKDGGRAFAHAIEQKLKEINQ